ncbi:hypothetical protein AA103196_0502 [Ameyamaea chiangmaiensis NBRC 103196]|nr:hypothetical protein AA103196_0502 [Ameyamaea chiangmaiensis NBRC 103196]
MWNVVMHASTIVEFNGILLGAALTQCGGPARRFFAMHESVRTLHDRVAPDLGALHRQVMAQFLRTSVKKPSVSGRGGAHAVGAACC